MYHLTRRPSWGIKGSSLLVKLLYTFKPITIEYKTVSREFQTADPARHVEYYFKFRKIRIIIKISGCIFYTHRHQLHRSVEPREAVLIFSLDQPRWGLTFDYSGRSTLSLYKQKECTPRREINRGIWSSCEFWKNIMLEKILSLIARFPWLT